MALIDPSQTRHIEIPHEPGEWVELKVLTARDTIAMQRKSQDGEASLDGLTADELTIRILLATLKGWSYASPINEEALQSLDHKTFRWLETESLSNGVRSPDEKKDSDSPSSPTTEPEMGSSPENSPT